jgi:hypothetical protein
MGKSLEEIWQKMQEEKLNQKTTKENEEKKLYEAREKARQEYIQRNRMYENFVPLSSSSAAGAGGGRQLQSQTQILTCDFIGQLYFISKSGIVPCDVQPFTGPVTLSDCQDDPNFIYYVTLDDDKSVFGKFNKNSFQRTDIDTVNLDSLTQEIPASLYYSGSNNFVYLVPFIDSSEDSQLYQISTNGDVDLLSATANDNSQVYGVCEFNGTTYASVSDTFLSSLYTLDVNTFDKEQIDGFSMNVDTLPEGITNTKVWLVFDMAVYKGEIWANVIFTDKSVGGYPYQCIGKINPETAEIDYYLPTVEGFGTALTSVVVY